MKIIVGLGNPGPKYNKTRHNIGFSVIDEFASHNTVHKKERKAKCMLQFCEHNSNELILVKPRTFINNSGIAIKYLLDRFQFELSDLLIIYDDIALPVGKIRVREHGSSGGHNGIKSIIKVMGGNDFHRLRVGIGSPMTTNVELVDWVLGTFNPNEKIIMDQTISHCMDILSFWTNNDMHSTMNTFN